MTDRPSWDEMRQRSPQRYEGHGLYAAKPGTGPIGKTCHDCAHLRYSHHSLAKHPKCGKAPYTHGDATTIKTGTPACYFFAPHAPGAA